MEVSTASGQLIPISRLRIVLWHPLAVVVHQTYAVLRLRVALIRRALKPFQSLGVIRPMVVGPAIVVENAQLHLSGGVSAFGRRNETIESRMRWRLSSRADCPCRQQKDKKPNAPR